jgi:hypothetical protein
VSKRGAQRSDGGRRVGILIRAAKKAGHHHKKTVAKAKKPHSTLASK